MFKQSSILFGDMVRGIQNQLVSIMQLPKWIIKSGPDAKLLIILIAKCTKPPSRVAKLMSVSIYVHMWFRQSIESSQSLNMTHISTLLANDSPTISTH